MDITDENDGSGNNSDTYYIFSYGDKPVTTDDMNANHSHCTIISNIVIVIKTYYLLYKMH